MEGLDGLTDSFAGLEVSQIVWVFAAYCLGEKRQAGVLRAEFAGEFDRAPFRSTTGSRSPN